MNAVTCQCGKEWKIQDNLSAYEGEVVLVCECGRRHFNAQDFFSEEALAELEHVSVNKGDIVTALLRCGDIRHSNSLYMLAAEEIQRLRAELDDATLEQAWAERNAAVAELHNHKETSQAREAKLRHALEAMYAGTNLMEWDVRAVEFFKEAIQLPTDDTALQEAIRQAKRDALLEAADAMESGAFETPYGLRRMAEELK